MASLGIDLGTTYSGAASLVDGNIVNISHQSGKSVISSMVTVTSKEYIVGNEEEAPDEDDEEEDSPKTIYDSKRMIGRKFSDLEIQRWLSIWPFQVIEEGDGMKILVKLCNETRKFMPTDISAMILKRLKDQAEEQLGKPIEFAVITVPARFNHHQRKATSEACKLAGFNRCQLFQEPTAAAFDYAKRNALVNGSKILVYDLGGGTFDASVIEKTDETFEVKFTDGDTALGGRDFDHRLALMVKKKFESKHKCDLTPHPKLFHRLVKKCAVAKKLLSEKLETTIMEKYFYETKDLKVTVSRADFERENQDLFKKTMDIVDRLLKCANLTKEQIDICLAVGGSSRIPKIKELLKNHFSLNKVNFSSDPEQAIMHGAARYAEHLYRPNNSDRSIWKDICPLNLGIKNAKGEMAVLIPRCTSIPCEHTHPTTTSFSGQTSIVIDVYEGDEPKAEHNVFIGTCELTNIPAAPPGQVVAFVKFEYTIEAILKVSVKCQQNGEDVAINIRLAEARQKATRATTVDVSNMTIRGPADRRRALLVDKLRVMAHKFNNLSQSPNNALLRKKANEILNWLQTNPEPSENDVIEKTEELEAASQDTIAVSD